MVTFTMRSLGYALASLLTSVECTLCSVSNSCYHGFKSFFPVLRGEITSASGVWKASRVLEASDDAKAVLLLALGMSVPKIKKS